MCPLLTVLDGTSSDDLRSPANSRDVEVSLKHQCLVWEGGKGWLSRPCSWLKLWKELDERTGTELQPEGSGHGSHKKDHSEPNYHVPKIADEY